MPGLMSIREEYSTQLPLQGVRFTGSLHMTIQTAVLIETLVELGADVRMGKLQYLLHTRSCSSSNCRLRNTCFRLKGMSLEDYWDCTLHALSHEDGQGPQLIVDDGGGRDITDPQRS